MVGTRIPEPPSKFEKLASRSDFLTDPFEIGARRHGPSEGLSGENGFIDGHSRRHPDRTSRAGNIAKRPIRAQRYISDRHEGCCGDRQESRRDGEWKRERSEHDEHAREQRAKRDEPKKA